MKRTYVRIGVALVLLGALAAIPASTQVLSTGANDASRRAGDDLPLLLVVNRLELSRAQMETLRTTIRGLLDEQTALESKRADFENEMIAFHGTAEELDARIAAFDEAMAVTRQSLRSKVAAAVDTVKETLTMKQGEVLLEAFPGLFGRLDAVSTRAMAVASESLAESVRAVAVAKDGTATAPRGRIVVAEKNGRMITITTPGTESATSAAGTAQSDSSAAGRMQRIVMPSGTAEVEGSSRAAAMVTKVGAVVEKVRERLAGRFGGSVETPAAPCPGCPIMGTGTATGADLAVGDSPNLGSVGDFGTLTIPLADPESVGLVGRGMAAGAGSRAVDGLERLLRILELKLAAIP